MKSPVLLLASILPLAAAPRINEVHANPPGTDAVAGVGHEYIEIISDTGGVESLAGCKLLLLDSDGGNMGRVDGLWDLDAMSTGSNGILLLGLDLVATGGGPWAGRIAPGTALADIAIPPGKDGLIEPNRAWELILVKNFGGSIVVGSTDLSSDNIQLNLGVRNTLQDAVGLNEHLFNAADNAPPAPLADLSQAVYSPGNVSRLVGNTTANSAAAWFGGEVSGVDSTSLTFDFARRFGPLPDPAATPGAPNSPPTPAELRINEVAINPGGPDNNHEFIELLKIGGESTTGQGYHLLVVNTDPSSDVTCGGDRSTGVIVEAWPLDEVEFGANGLALIGQDYDDDFSPWREHADPATRFSDIGGAASPEAEKLGNDDIGNEIRVKTAGLCGLTRSNAGFTLLLVKDFTGAALQDLDVDDNGTLDSQPWGTLVDSVGFSHLAPTYALADLGQPGYLPDNLSRKAGDTTPNSAAAFYGGNHAGDQPSHIGFGDRFFGGFRGQATPGRANLAAALPTAPLVVNEVNFAPPGDAAEFIELRSEGELVAAAQGLSLLVVATAPGNSGEVLESYDLGESSTGPNGLLLIGDGFNTGATAIFPAGSVRPRTSLADPGFTAGDLPDRDFAVLLVENFSGGDLDADDDGVIDAGHEIVDGVSSGPLAHPRVAVLSTALPAGNISRGPAGWYGGSIAGPDPGGLAFASGFGPWLGSVTPGQGNHAAAPGGGPVLINEANINPPGDDADFDYVELIATDIAARSMNGLTLVAIDTSAGDDGLGDVGEITRVWNLDALATGRNGLLLMGDGYPAGGPFTAVKSPLTATGDPVGMGEDSLASNDGFALLLVRGFTGQPGQDLDAGNDNTLDAAPWSEVADAIVFGDRDYGFPVLSQAGYRPDNLSRGGRPEDLVANDALRWYGGNLIGTGGTDTAFDSVESFDPTGAVPAGAATPGVHNLGGYLDDPVDNDLDGLANLMELALATDPDLPDAGAFPTGSRVEVAGQPYLALSFSRRTGGSGSAGDYTADGIRYQVQVSGNLSGWAPADGEIVPVSVTDDGNGFSESVVVRLAAPVSPGEPRRFLRLHASRP